jgi:hypothetical protein
MKINSEVALLVRLIDEGFDARAWHGTPLRGAVRGLTAAQAAWRPAPGRHNIWEIVVHCAYWKYAVRRRLTGEKRGSFALKGSNWFARPTRGEAAKDAAWKRDVALLLEEHRKLREAIADLKPAVLHRVSRGSRYTPVAFAQGIAAHDLYHAGQIQLLKTLQRSRVR